MMVAAEETVMTNLKDHAQHILVCVSPSPSSPRIIQAALRMAEGTGCQLSALYIRRPDTVLSRSEEQRLGQNRALLQEHGVELETVESMDVALEISAVAQAAGITEIFLGSSGENRLFQNGSIGARLIRYLPGVEIHIIPDASVTPRPSEERRPGRPFHLEGRDLFLTVAIMALATLISYFFWLSSYDNANILTIYLLAVLLSAAVTKDYFYSLLAAVLSILLFNFFFTEPLYTLLVYDARYFVTYLVLFAASLLAGTLAYRLKYTARQSAQNAYGTRVLYETSELFQKAEDEHAVIDITCTQLVRLLDRTVIYYPLEGEQLGEPLIYPAAAETPDHQVIEAERTMAETARQDQAAETSGTFPAGHYLYLPVREDTQEFGVLGLGLQTGLDSSEKHLLLSIVNECAISIGEKRSLRQKELAEIEAEKQKFRATLLRSISHDLRTPLTSINGNADNLLQNGSAMDEADRQSIYQDIRDDSDWLIGMVENLLAVTRLQEGSVLHETTELVEDVVQEALKHVDRNSQKHTIEVQIEDMLTARMDSRLIIQVLVNLVNNAVKYTPDGSLIRISAWQQGEAVLVQVADNGPGIAPADQPHIFDLFYTGTHSLPDAGRSVGMGLYLCRSIIEAHGGTIAVSDNAPHGAVFTFRLRHEEVDLDGSQNPDSRRGG